MLFRSLNNIHKGKYLGTGVDGLSLTTAAGVCNISGIQALTLPGFAKKNIPFQLYIMRSIPEKQAIHVLEMPVARAT